MAEASQPERAIAAQGVVAGEQAAIVQALAEEATALAIEASAAPKAAVAAGSAAAAATQAVVGLGLAAHAARLVWVVRAVGAVAGAVAVAAGGKGNHG